MLKLKCELHLLIITIHKKRFAKHVTGLENEGHESDETN